VERHVILLAILSRVWGALGLLLGVSMLILAGGALGELLDPMSTASEFLAVLTTAMLGTVGLFGTAWGGTHLWAAALLKRVGISKRLDADALVSTLSGGERQSIAISRAMQFAAKVIILDEPTNNLGVEETHGVLRFVKEVRDAGHTVLFITHNIHHVFQVADRIIVMRRGEVVAERNVAETDLLTVESLIMGVDVSTLAKDAKAH